MAAGKILQLDILVASFVHSANSITELRYLMGEKRKKIDIISNIQTIEGFHNFDDILSANVSICISAQLLSSTDYNRIQLRKKILDVANYIKDGADALIIFAETAVEATRVGLASETEIGSENRVQFCTKWVMEQGVLRIRDSAIVVSGWRQDSGFTNTIRIIYVTAETGVNIFKIHITMLF